ncbi:AAA family ATPase [Alkalimarinus coralli]|uniref:bifunctional aminoglycoside phosphotransferase/ATP-binding protein n=1 Tax=Alkalimarinus coralli TaxID=2935863 RepID=UPI00202AE97F|nr:bifunctional aminoglycoside phosphotransferase/ATP-binding protein [Alkalimarinus coralli]
MSVKLIKALQNPTLYDHPTKEITVLETHISWVILTGHYAYKIKKPVNFGFLDFSSLDKRKHFCHEELRLNRRLASELYIGVIPIYGTDTQPRLAEQEEQNAPEEQPIEYALKMVQFDQSGLLDTLQETQQLTPTHINALAKQLAEFHQTVSSHPPNSEFGASPAVFAPVNENFEQIQTALPPSQPQAQLNQLKRWATSEFNLLKARIDQRKQQGFVRECHGDLHLGNITLFNQSLTIFDCIEFNPSLSWIDVISDLAFLVMDLEMRGEKTFANQLTNCYLETTGDYQGAALLKFYKAYRAMVRAKVAVLSLDNHHEAADANAQLMQRYQQYIALATRYERPSHCYLLVMHGLSGSGKSNISRQLVEQLGAIRIRSDVERKRLFHYNAETDTQSPPDGGIYTQNATKMTYDHVAGLSENLLKAGLPVIVDAANLKQWQRNLFRDIAINEGAPLLIISCHASSDILRARVIKRAEQNEVGEEHDASEAKIDTLETQFQMSEPLSDAELKYAIQIDTSQPNPLAVVIKRVKSLFPDESMHV